MKNHLAIAAIALLFLTATNAHAACNRDDVSFYLSEGFTQEQITAICTMATKPVAPSTPVSPEPAAPSTPATPEPAAVSIPATPELAGGGGHQDAERYLREAIKGDDVHIEEGFLHYTARVCIPYGRPNDYKADFPKQACEQVRHKVTLRGMIAKREFISMKLFQPRQIYVEGQIEREFVSGLKDFNSVNRRQIIQNLQKEVKAIVPIKENMSTDRLLESLNKIAT